MLANRKNLKILVVEDNPGDCVLIEEYLSESLESPEIINVSTYTDAEKTLGQKNHFDIILLDLSLPDLSGEKLVREVVQISGQIPIIVLTGYENKDFGLKTMSMGVADYLLKDEISPFMLGKVVTYSIERNRAKESLHQSEKKYRDIFNLSPQPMFLIDVAKRTILDVNIAAVNQYGYPKEEFVGMHLKDIRPQEEIQNFEKEIEKIDSSKSQFYKSYLKHQRKNGEIFDVKLSTSEISLDGKHMRMALAEDITDKLEAERAVKQKNKLLAASAEVSSSLINTNDLLKVLDDSFEMIGKAANVDRVAFFEASIDEKTGNSILTQRLEWSAESIEPQLDNPDLLSIEYDAFPEVMSFLLDNKPYKAIISDLPDGDLKDLFIPQDIESVLVLPIFVDDKFYGFIGFDDCTKKREWENHEIQYLQTIASNISASIKLRQTRSELEYREKRFKALVQEGSDLIAIMDEKFRFKYISPSIGLEHNSYLNLKAQSLIHPDDLERITESLKKLKETKRIVLEPYRLQDHTGEYHWVETIITNLLDEPAVQGYVANSRNVTHQIKREEKLRELSLVAAKTTDAVIITDADGLITWINNGFIDLSGYKLEEVRGKKPGTFLQGPDTDPETVQKISAAIHRKEPIETTILNYAKDGVPYWLNMIIDPIFNDAGQCTHFIAIERDVTEKIEKEKKLQESLERYNIVNKATSDTIWDLDLKTNQMIYNSNIYDMFGYQKTEVENMAEWWRDKIHPEDIEVINQTLSDVMEAGKERFQMEYRFKAANGSYKHIFDRAFVIQDETDTPVRMIGAMQDITHQVEEEERLKLFKSVITNTTESVVILEADPSDMPGRKILFVNDAFTKLTGYSKEDALGNTLQFLNGPKTDPLVRKQLQESMENYEKSEVEFINYRKNGEEFWVNISMVPVADNEGQYTHWVAIGRDITEEKKYQAEIKASLSEKETLLSEIHHRVKNNLAVVSGMMQLQAFETENDDLQAKLYDSVVRIKTMATVHELLYQSNSFSRLEFSQTLKRLVQNISETLQTSNKIDLDIECEPITLNINQAIPASLIVNEVITNAYKHAFSEKKEGKICFSLTEQENVVHIEITDNGVGINENDLEQKGSLGLHLIQVLSEQIDATNTYSKLKKGTKFTLEFEKQNIKSGIGNAQLT